MSQTRWVEGECSWCRQCGRDGVREEKVRSRRELKRNDEYGRGRFVRWEG